MVTKKNRKVKLSALSDVVYVFDCDSDKANTHYTAVVKFLGDIAGGWNFLAIELRIA